MSYMLLHPASIVQPFLWWSWESLYIEKWPQLGPLVGTCVAPGLVLPQFWGVEGRVGGQEQKSSCSYLTPFWKFCADWVATADISALLGKVPVVCSFTAAYKEDQMECPVLASAAMWLRPGVGIQLSSLLVQPQDVVFDFGYVTQSLRAFSSSFLLCHYSI